ncbi:MAG: FkbM family methyltransferase, partial [Bryobacteraceae bacterium]
MLLVVGAVPVAYRFSPQARVLMLSAAGRNPVCPLPLALQAQAMIDEHIATMARISAASRVIRTDGDLELWQTPAGEYWIPKGAKSSNHQGGGDTLSSILAESQRRIYGKGETGVKPADIVIDGGAHVGTFTRQSIQDGASLVIAVEPSPKNVECLRRNLEKEIAAGKVIVYTKGVWDTETTLAFHVDDESTARDTIVEGPAGKGDILVPVTTIDRLAEELKLPRVDFIKMDIEGSERRALAGARTTIGKFKP